MFLFFFLGRGLRSHKWDATILIQTTKSSITPSRSQEKVGACAIFHDVWSTTKIQKEDIEEFFANKTGGLFANTLRRHHALRKNRPKKTQRTLSGWWLVNLKGAMCREADNTSTKSMLQIGDTILWVFTLWFICLSQKQWEIWIAKVAWEMKWDFFFLKKKKRKLPLARIKSNWMRPHRGSTKTVHFATLMDLYHLKTSEIEKQFQKHKKARRFTWRCSEKMILDRMQCPPNEVLSHPTLLLWYWMYLRGCHDVAGEAGDVVFSASHSGQDERCSKTVEIIWNWLFRFLDTQIIGQNEEMCMVYHICRINCERESSPRFSDRRTGKGTRLGTL